MFALRALCGLALLASVSARRRPGQVAVGSSFAHAAGVDQDEEVRNILIDARLKEAQPQQADASSSEDSETKKGGVLLGDSRLKHAKPQPEPVASRSWPSISRSWSRFKRANSKPKPQGVLAETRFEQAEPQTSSSEEQLATTKDADRDAKARQMIIDARMKDAKPLPEPQSSSVEDTEVTMGGGATVLGDARLKHAAPQPSLIAKGGVATVLAETRFKRAKQEPKAQTSSSEEQLATTKDADMDAKARQMIIDARMKEAKPSPEPQTSTVEDSEIRKMLMVARLEEARPEASSVEDSELLKHAAPQPELQASLIAKGGSTVLAETRFKRAKQGPKPHSLSALQQFPSFDKAYKGHQATGSVLLETSELSAMLHKGKAAMFSFMRTLGGPDAPSASSTASST